MLKKLRTDDAATSNGGSFVNLQLEMLNPTLNEPLVQTTWARDVPTGVGGGEVDFVRNLFIDYKGSTGTDPLVNGKTNVIPKVSLAVDQDVVKVNKWAQNLGMGYEETMQAMQAGWYPDLSNSLQKAITLMWNKQLDLNGYLGIGGATGLINNPTVTAYQVALNAGATSRLWANKTALEIQADIDTILSTPWNASNNIDAIIPDRLLVPVASYTALNKPMTTGGFSSIRGYILENNLLYNRTGKRLEILPLLQLTGAGTGGSNRMVAYTYSEEYVKQQITVPLQKIGDTQFILENREYLTGYRGYYSDIMVKYPTTMAYADGL